MEKQFYFLSPVEVVKVTTKNMQEVAEWCGGRVAKTESRKVAGRMDSYVWVPTPKGSVISWAFPGMFITKRLVLSVKDEVKATYSVFRRDYFEKNYFESPQAAVDATWDKGSKKKPAEFTVQGAEDLINRADVTEIVKAAVKEALDDKVKEDNEREYKKLAQDFRIHAVEKKPDPETLKELVAQNVLRTMGGSPYLGEKP